MYYCINNTYYYLNVKQYVLLFKRIYTIFVNFYVIHYRKKELWGREIRWISIITIRILSFIENLLRGIYHTHCYIQIISNSIILQVYSNIITILQMRKSETWNIITSSKVVQLVSDRVLFGT